MEPGGSVVTRKYLDGDTSKISYVDTTPERGENPFFQAGRLYSGRPVFPDFVPTKLKWNSKRNPPPDVLMHDGLILVSEEFKDVVEELESNVHQFFPIEVVFKDGGFARQMYFFNICNRLDTVDRERATVKFDAGWLIHSGEFVFSLDLIDGRHIWIDKFIVEGRLVSDEFKLRVEKAELTGITFGRYPVY